MAEATIYAPYVKNLHVEYLDGNVSGLTADIAWDISVNDLGLATQVQKQNIDIWGLLTANQKTGLQTLVNKIVNSVED